MSPERQNDINMITEITEPESSQNNPSELRLRDKRSQNASILSADMHKSGENRNNSFIVDSDLRRSGRYSMDNLDRINNCEANLKFYSNIEIEKDQIEAIKSQAVISPVTVARLNDLDQVLSGEIAETKIRHHAFSQKRFPNRNTGSIFNKQQM